MSKKVIILFGILIGAGLLLFMVFSQKSPFGKANSSFASEPKREITKIELSGGSKELTLEKRDGMWLLNGKSEARRGAVLFIEKILKDLEIKSPVSDELFDKEIIQKGLEPVQVRVFENRKILKSFLVYKTKSNSYGNIMQRKMNSLPFIVSVPGFDGDIGSGFTLNELFWLPYTLFNLLPSEISSVRFENLNDTSASFSITNREHHFTLSDLNQDLSGWDSAVVSRYLSYFTYVPFESWALDLGEDDIVKIKESPLYRITIKNVNGNLTSLVLWKKFLDQADGKKIDSDRLYGKVNEGEPFFILRYFDIDPLIKKRSYFFPH